MTKKAKRWSTVFAKALIARFYLNCKTLLRLGQAVSERRNFTSVFADWLIVLVCAVRPRKQDGCPLIRPRLRVQLTRMIGAFQGASLPSNPLRIRFREAICIGLISTSRE